MHGEQKIKMTKYPDYTEMHGQRNIKMTKLTVAFLNCANAPKNSLAPLGYLTSILISIFFSSMLATLLLLLLHLLIMLALQPTILGDFLPLRPFLAQFPPPSYSHRLDIFLNVFNPSFPWSTSDSPTH